MRILVHNTQRRSVRLELFSLADFVCLSRLRRDFAPLSGWVATYQNSFPGADNGTAIFARRAGQGWNLSDRVFRNQNQSTALCRVDTGEFALIHALPPYPENDEVSREDYERYVRQIVADSGTASVLVGDFHFEMQDMGHLVPLRAYARAPNFLDLAGRPLNLTKFFSGLDLHVSESVFESPEPGMHFPVLFEVRRA